jgi:hypothetical protein
VILLFGIGPGYVLLLALVVYVVIFVRRLLADPNGLLPLMCVGFVLGLLLYIWMLIPRAVRGGVQKGARWLMRKHN